MIAAAFSGGHLAWPLFAGLVFSLALLLLVDIVWRMIAMRFFILLAIALLLWAGGLVLIYLA